MDIMPDSGMDVYSVIRSNNTMAVPKNEFTRAQLEKMSVVKLRGVAREMKLKGAWLVSAHAEDLVDAIITGKRPVTANSDFSPKMQEALHMFAEEFAKILMKKIEQEAEAVRK
jgi:hypothetical protein